MKATLSLLTLICTLLPALAQSGLNTGIRIQDGNFSTTSKTSRVTITGGLGTNINTGALVISNANRQITIAGVAHTFPTTASTVARTDAAQSFTGAQTFGTPVAVGSGGTGLASGTSGGVPYFSGSTTIASSAALAANALVIGGGAGAAPATTTTGSGILTWLGTPSSANLASAVTDETGSGALVFGTSPQLSGIELSHASANTVAASGGFATIEGKPISSPINAVAGDIQYFDGSQWVRLAKGTAGQVLEMNAGATAPEWDTDDTAAGGESAGTVHNSGTPVQYALPRYSDTTGTNIGPSNLSTDATGTNLFVGALTASNSISVGSTVVTLGSSGSGALTITAAGGNTEVLGIDLGTNANTATLFSTSGLTLIDLLTGALGLSANSIELGHASDTTISRTGAGEIAVEGNRIFRAGGADVPVVDGGTGASSLNDLITLSTHTTGNYAASDAEAGGATIIRQAATDTALAAAGEMALNTADEQVSFHSGADGEISGEVSVSLIMHKTWSFDPDAVCDGAVDRLFLMTIGDDLPEGMIIDEWKVSFEADPTTEVDLDLKYADAYIGVANPVVVDVLDTTAGVSSEDTDANINGGAAIPNGKVIYLEFGTAYTETTHQIIFELWYHAEED